MKAYTSHESSENYLESILRLSMDKSYVRAIDIATMLNFSKPSVSVALKRLKEEGKVEVDSNGFITLTEDGLEIARSTYEKHVVLTNFLVSLGVSSYTAAQDACRIEHVISAESFQALKKFYQNQSSEALTD